MPGTRDFVRRFGKNGQNTIPVKFVVDSTTNKSVSYVSSCVGVLRRYPMAQLIHRLNSKDIEMNKTIIAITLALGFSPAIAFAQREKGGDNNAQRLRRGEFQRPETQRPGPGNPGRPDGQPGGAPMGMMGRFLPVMLALDTDEDGVLSATEIENASKALLKLDKDGDGILSAEELRPDPSKMPGMMAGPGPNGPGGPGGVMGAPTAAMMVKMFEQRDSNKDGKLTGDEIPDRMRERISMIDKDGDGAISKSELDRAGNMLGDRPGQRGRNESDGGGVKPKRPGSDK